MEELLRAGAGFGVGVFIHVDEGGGEEEGVAEAVHAEADEEEPWRPADGEDGETEHVREDAEDEYGLKAETREHDADGPDEDDFGDLAEAHGGHDGVVGEA